MKRLESMTANLSSGQTALSDKDHAFSLPSLREGAALVFILLLAAFLRLWRLDQNGTGNPYYAAAVRSMLMSFHNFFFVSFDPGGFVTVDKPPMALWVQTLSAKLLGFKGFSLIIPQVLEGLGSIAILYHLVRRRFGAGAALISGLVLALMPVSVAVDRYNNTDACLVLVLLLAAWALLRAVEKGSAPLLYLALILVGVGFNTKMMAAFVVLPAFFTLYLLGAPKSWPRRLTELFIGGLMLSLVALSWPLAVDLTPPEQRPYVGSTQDNSMIGLSLGWNGFQRLLSRGRNGLRPYRNQAAGGPAATLGNSNGVSTPSGPDTASEQEGSQGPTGLAGRGPGGAGPRGRRGNGMDTGTPGPLRLADKNMAGQVAWFLPMTLLGFAGTWRRLRPPWNPELQNRVFWLGWFLLYALVFSFMKGAMHAYYLVLLAPPLAALAGIGAWTLWNQFKEGKKTGLFAALFLTAAWQAFITCHYPDWGSLLLPILGPWIGLCLAGLIFFRTLSKTLLSFSMAGLFLCPSLWALTPVLGSGQSVEASPDLLTQGPRGAFGPGGGGQGITLSKLLSFLKAKHGEERFLVAAQNSQTVAPIIIQTGESAVALGGFMGSDPILTQHEFAEEVQKGTFRFMLLSEPPRNPEGNRGGGYGGGFGGGFGGRMTGAQAEIAKWVRENGKPVDPALWKPALPPTPTPTPGAGNFGGRGFGGRRGTLANLELYDLRPSWK